MRIGPRAKCARCGQVADGFATIDGKRYCHGDDVQPTCYELESRERVKLTAWDILGIAPNATGDMTTAEYIKRIRS